MHEIASRTRRLKYLVDVVRHHDLYFTQTSPTARPSFYVQQVSAFSRQLPLLFLSVDHLSYHLGEDDG